MSIAIVALLVLVIVVIVAVPIFIRVLGEAARRNPNRPEGEGDETGETEDRESRFQVYSSRSRSPAAWGLLFILARAVSCI